jgi:hypothetical protein
VKCGETPFAFQISGGRRISGEAEVMWVDDVGIMGGLRFLNLPVEARKQIGLWLVETNAPEEHGTFEPAATAAINATRNSRPEAEAASARSRDYRQSSPAPAGVRAIEEEPPPAPPWTHLRPASSPPMYDDRFAMPALREDVSFVAARARSAAVWRSIAVLATVTALAALLVVYQREVGNSLIWLGEVLSGKTKASVMTPESKPADAYPPDVNAPNAKSSESNTPLQKPEEADATPKKSSPPTTPVESQPAKLDATNGQRQESMLERQVSRDRPETYDSGESVESLWGAVQGGSISAERSLAERFVRGDGVAKNCEQAKVLLKAAADRGSKEARLRLYELETQGCR